MQRAIEQAVEALGPVNVYSFASQAADTLRRTCQLATRETPNGEWLASVLADMEMACDMVRILAGPSLVDLAKVEALFCLQQRLNSTLPGRAEFSTSIERDS